MQGQEATAVAVIYVTAPTKHGTKAWKYCIEIESSEAYLKERAKIDWHILKDFINENIIQNILF